MLQFLGLVVFTFFVVNDGQTTETRAIKITFEGISAFSGDAIWKKWEKIPVSEQKCIQTALISSLKAYLGGSQDAVVNTTIIKKMCPKSFQNFQNIYKQLSSKAIKQSVLIREKLTTNVTSAIEDILDTIEAYRQKKELMNDSGKLATVNVIFQELNNLDENDLENLSKIFPEISKISLQNLKAVINDYVKKFNGEQVDQNAAKQRLQTLLNEIHQGFSEK
uniref:Uncharacterized protein n=1 Tax=Panagrolaimus sp. JU765 TaxID=591449 RepID=A0AC34QXB4_9BILA